jgi:type IV pilus assembly protein PilV
MLMTSGNPFNRQRGVGLIEVLVAILMVSFAVLAMAGLQTVAKKNTRESLHRSTAALLARSLIERMRANSSEQALDAYLDASSNGVGGGLMGATPLKDCKLQDCSPTELAYYDLWQWEQVAGGSSELIIDGAQTDVVGGLLQPYACLTGPAGGGDGIYTLTMVWYGSVELPGDTTVACALGTGGYGANDEYRRTLTLSAYVAAS